jgi:type IV pilus assembly protein PilA
MFRKLRNRAQEQKGFTLVELLVVILIIATLAEIAIPLFLNQTAKANDTAAKSQLNAAATTMQACADRNAGDYTNCTLTAIEADEPTFSDTRTVVLEVSNPGQTGYTLTSSVVATGDVFTLTENNGVESRTCSSAQTSQAAGRCESGTW